MLRHHVADGQEPALSTLGFVLSGGEKLILPQCLISLKQIWKTLLEDEIQATAASAYKEVKDFIREQN